MFLAGLELHLSDLAKTGKVSALAGVLGVVFPLVLGFGAGLILNIKDRSALFLGLILAATSVSISAQTLIELKILRSEVGISLLGAAVFDDILVILSLSIFSAFLGSSSGNGWNSILQVFLQMVLYIFFAILLGLIFLPKASRKMSSLPISQGLIAFVIVIILLYGWSAEVFGSMTAITGAFLAGLMLARSPVKERIENGIVAIAFGLFVPVFFINVGLSTNLRELVTPTLWLFLIMALTAIVGKVFGSGIGAILGGFSSREALQLGIGMMSRGEVGLIVATVGVSEGWISSEVFSAIVGVVIVTTLLTPPLLRASFNLKPKEKLG